MAAKKPKFKVKKNPKLRPMNRKNGDYLAPVAPLRATALRVAANAVEDPTFPTTEEVAARDQIGVADLVEPSNIFTLSDGTDVAVSFTATRVENGNTLACLIQAWVVDADGVPELDARGRPIMIEYIHNAGVHEIEAFGAEGLAAAVLYAAMGEPIDETSPLKLAPDLAQEVSIRAAIATGRATKEVINLATVVLPVVPAPTQE